MPSPNASAFGGVGSLSAAACTSVTHCVAVGDYETENGNFQTLIEENVGRGWNVVPSPNNNPLEDNSLAGVACASQSLCIAVGSRGLGGNSQPLIEQNSGSGWTIVRTSGVGALSGVACPSPHFCVATGGNFSVSSSTITEEPLIEEMTNGKWVAVATPHQVGTLGRVACPTPTYCISVGDLYLFGLSTGSPLIIAERRSNEWTVGTTSDIGSAADTFGAVACPGADRCIATGDQLVGTRYPSVRATFIAQHTSRGWVVQGSPNS